MTNEPMCLFKNMIMRKPEKPSLQKAMVTDEESNKLGLTSGQNNYSYVMDGGALLHRLCWLRGSNFKKIAKSYVQYVWMHYGKCYIVFDGYESASTKSAVQKQRRKRFQKCQDVDVKEDIIVPFTQIKILSNTNNKGQLIKMLSQYLIDDENKVTTVPVMQIPLSAILHWIWLPQGKWKLFYTVIFVMLIYHWKSEMKNIFFQQKMLRGWNIASLFPRLDKVKDHILFVHAMTGCDTT